MRLLYIVFSILNFYYIFPNFLYIDEDLICDENIINLEWLKKTVLEHNNIIISEMNYIPLPKNTFSIIKREIPDKEIIGKKNIIEEKYESSKQYFFKGKILKIEIKDDTDLSKLIKDIIDKKANKFVSVSDIDICIRNYFKDKNKYDSDNNKYSIDINVDNNLIKNMSIDDYSEDNQVLCSLKYLNKMNKVIDKTYFFSYFSSLVDCGIFENSKLSCIYITSCIKNDSFANYNRLCMNSQQLQYGQVWFYNVQKCHDMFANCKNLLGVFLTYINRDDYLNFSRIFKNCQNLKMLNFGRITENGNSMRLNDEIFYSCNNDIPSPTFDADFFIDDKTTGIKDVFFNCKNAKDITINIKESCKLKEIDLDKMFNGSYISEITIKNPYKKNIKVTKDILKNKNLKIIKIIIDDKNQFVFNKDAGNKENDIEKFVNNHQEFIKSEIKKENIKAQEEIEKLKLKEKQKDESISLRNNVNNYKVDNKIGNGNLLCSSTGCSCYRCL